MPSRSTLKGVKRFDLALVPVDTVNYYVNRRDVTENWDLMIVESVRRNGIVNIVSPLYAYDNMKKGARGEYPREFVDKLMDPHRTILIVQQRRIDVAAAVKGIGYKYRFGNVASAQKALKPYLK
jgi:hypothetical protein